RPRREWHAPPAAGILLEQTRPAVRLLHARDDPRVGGARRRVPAADARARAPRARRQSVPLHGLPEHRPRCVRRGGSGRSMMAGKVFGSAIRRREDPRLITGTATYTDDLTMPGLLHAAILRSPHAHAKIKKIDTTRAKAAPGVVAVYTGADTKSALQPMP